MEYETFKDTITEKLKSSLEEGRTLCLHTAEKLNGVVLDALTIKDKEHDTAPTFYIQDLFALYSSGTSMDEIAAFADEAVSAAWEYDEEKPDLLSFESVKDRICCYIVNTAANEKLLAGIPSARFLDLSVIFRILLQNTGTSGHITIDNMILKKWGKSVNELLRIAALNTRKLNAVKVCPISQAIAEKTLTDNLELDAEGSSLQVITSQSGAYGAIYITDKVIMDQLCSQFDDDLVIIPSSIHEILVMPAKFAERSKIDKVIEEVNEAVIDAREYLSDHSYIYNREMRRMTI